MHEEDNKIQDDMDNPLACLASFYPETMHFDHAMNQPDRMDFLNASTREVNSQYKCKHWKLLPRAEVINGKPILESVWAMKIKRDILTNNFYKLNKRLNENGGQKECGVN